MFVKFSLGVHSYVTFCNASWSLEYSSLHRAAATVTTDRHSRTSAPHPTGRGLPSLCQDRRNCVSMCGSELPLGASGLPGIGGELGAKGMTPPGVQREVSEHR